MEKKKVFVVLSYENDDVQEHLKVFDNEKDARIYQRGVAMTNLIDTIYAYANPNITDPKPEEETLEWIVRRFVGNAKYHLGNREAGDVCDPIDAALFDMNEEFVGKIDLYEMSVM